MASNTGMEWVTRRYHLKVSSTQVLPVIFKARKAASSSETTGPVPPAFPHTQVEFSESLQLVKEWLLEHVDRLHRIGSVNVKPGSFETPDVLRNGTHRFTVWLEPTAASFSVLIPKEEARTDADKDATREADATGRNDDRQDYDGYTPTVQTLHLVGEIEN